MTRFSILLVGSLILLLCLTQASSAALIQIQLGGVGLRYTGNTIFDAGTADPDPLTNATFLVDGVPVGEDTSGVTLDLRIPGLANIPVGGGQVNSSAIGSLDLDLGDGEYLSLSLDTAVVTYIPLTSTIQFVFVGSTASSTGQNLPYEISIDDPIGVSFSTQITEPISHGGGFVSVFRSAGTGEIQGFGVGIPEPATMSLLALGGLALLRRRRV